MKFPEALLPVTERSFVVDAAQGIEAQTLANVYMALDHDLDGSGDQQDRPSKCGSGACYQ